MTIPDRILGVAGILLLATAVFLTGRSLLGGETEPAVIPALEILDLRSAPPAGALIVFQAGERLEEQPGGWGAEGLHLHAEVNGLEVMPGPRAIERGSNATYEWLLPAGEADSMRVSLYWSDAQHRRIEGTTSRALTVTTR